MQFCGLEGFESRGCGEGSRVWVGDNGSGWVGGVGAGAGSRTWSWLGLGVCGDGDDEEDRVSCPLVGSL